MSCRILAADPDSGLEPGRWLPVQYFFQCHTMLRSYFAKTALGTKMWIGGKPSLNP